MKLMVLGHAQHGKDTVCSLLHDFYGLRHISSSYFCLSRCVRKDLEAAGIVYASDEECYADRDNHRPLWFNSIARYNERDPARLGRELLQEFDIYCGLRNIREYNALRLERAFDVCLWVDRSMLVPNEPIDSFNIPMAVADFVINNNHDMDYLVGEVKRAHHFAELAIRDKRLAEKGFATR